MPTKKDLASLLNETPQQPLRRGRGLRLSRASKQAAQPAAKPSNSPEPAAPAARSSEPAAEAASAARSSEPAAEAAPATRSSEPAAEPASAVEPSAPAGDPAEAMVLPAPDAPKPERKQRKLLLRKDLLKQCKRIARAQDRKLYQVVESALEEYIQRYGAHE